jgi:hypothetical protein
MSSTVTLIVFFTKPPSLNLYKSIKDPTNFDSVSLEVRGLWYGSPGWVAPGLLFLLAFLFSPDGKVVQFPVNEEVA